MCRIKDCPQWTTCRADHECGQSGPTVASVAHVQVRLLGPVDVSEAGASRRVAGLRPKAVLAVLGLAAGQTVSTDRLVEVVWGDRPPATGLNTLQRHVSYLRSVLGGRGTIVARPPGYALALGGRATMVPRPPRTLRR